MISHSKHCSRQRQRKNWLRCILHTYSVLSFHYTLRCKITALREMIRLCWSCKTENAELSTLHERGHIEYIHITYYPASGNRILHMTQCRILGKLRYTWGPNFKVVLLMILVCQVHYYNIGSTLHKYECREMDIWLDICDIWFYKKGPLKSSKMLQLAWNFFWLDKIKIYCHLSFTNFSVRQVLNWFFLRYLPYWYLQGCCCKIVKINQICVKFVLRGNYKILLTPLLL